MSAVRTGLLIASVFALANSLPLCNALAQAAAPSALTGAIGETQSGLAAVYSGRLNGHRTASGQRYDPNALTAAHPTLPFGTKVKVTNVKNGKSAVLRINDRGPTQPNRIVDVSKHAAQVLGFGRHGLVEVRLEVVGTAKAAAKKSHAKHTASHTKHTQ